MGVVRWRRWLAAAAAAAWRPALEVAARCLPRELATRPRSETPRHSADRYCAPQPRQPRSTTAWQSTARTAKPADRASQHARARARARRDPRNRHRLHYLRRDVLRRLHRDRVRRLHQAHRRGRACRHRDQRRRDASPGARSPSIGAHMPSRAHANATNGSRRPHPHPTHLDPRSSQPTLFDE